MIGKRLAHYNVLDKLGAGGMGEVYRAEDTKLGRQVAIKVLPEDFAGDEERMARFEREARTLAALNHPNIAAIHGLEVDAGKSFLVMELVEGETLDQKLVRGALPVDEALEVCRQIAEAVEAAHEKGIIHRDLKPANVKITPEGRVKVLDFGLAKALVEEAEGPVLMDSPTLTAQMTQPGIILGTAPYMSPEQAKGKAVDKRSDIWAFGCILYECLTGKMAFSGESVSEVLAAILKEDPDWSLLPAETPSAIQRLLKRCLEKDPRRRLRDIGDAYIEIADRSEVPEDLPDSKSTYSGRKFRWNLILPWCLAAVCLVLAAIQYFLWSPNRSQSSKLIGQAHFNINLPPDAPLALVGSAPINLGQKAIALSPDGSLLVYAAETEERKTQLYLRSLDSQDAVPLPGTTNAYFPFFSPDSHWIGFFLRNELGVDSLMRISSQGGPVNTIYEAVVPLGASWSENDQIVFANREGRELLLISPDGELIKTIPWKTGLDIIQGPSFLPGGRHILVNDNVSAYVVSLETGEWKLLRYGGSDYRYIQSGHVVFIQDSVLSAASFDLSSHKIKGTPIPIIDNVRTENVRFGAQYSFSNDGTLVYVQAGAGKESELVWKDPTSGMEENLGFRPDIYGHFKLSPDGKKLVIVTWGRNTKLWIFDLERGDRSLLTDQGDNCIPIWAPDSEHIIYGARQEGSLTYDIYRIKIDGSAEEAILSDSEASVYPMSISADGKLLAYMREDPVTLADIWLLPMDGERKPRPFADSQRMEGLPIFSPDGKYVAYDTDETGQYEFYIRPLDPELGRRRPVSTGFAIDPIWPAGSKSLYYRSEYQWIRVDVETEPELTLSPPRVIMEGDYLDVPGFSFDVGPDGRLLVLKRKNEIIAESLNVIVNSFDDIERKVPTGK